MRQDAPRQSSEWAVPVLIIGGGAAAGAAYGTVCLQRLISGQDYLSPGAMFRTALQGSLDVQTPALVGAITVIVVPLLVLLVLLGRWNGKRVAGRLPIDRKARHLGSPKGYTRAAAETVLINGAPAPHGVWYGNAVGYNQPELVMNGEDTMLILFGPRQGKSTSIMIPAIIDAPGAVIATSNKRDIPDAIRGARESVGTFNVFDPLNIAKYHEGRPPWWWNALRGITLPQEAAELAGIFASARRPAGSQAHAYFDTRGPELLGHLILAAAVGNRQLTEVYRWVNNPDDKTPAKILTSTGHVLPAAFLQSMQPGEERASLYGTAANAVAFLADPGTAAWVSDDGTRPEFDVTAFAKSKTDTLVIMSREDAGAATPLCTALLMRVTTATEQYAATRKGGRLPVPMMLVLDEIANTAPWKALPDKVSFYGSAGMLPIVAFQSWSQGVEKWSEDGMRKLWGASTIRVVGSGLSDDKLFDTVVKLIGKQWIRRTSLSSGKSSSKSTSYERDDVLSQDELGAMPKGRMLVIPAGGVPILAKTVRWWERPAIAEQVAASIAKYEPADEVPAESDAVSLVKSDGVAA